MGVKIAAFKKLPPAEQYACSVLEVQKWAKGLADLRIEFGTRKSFRFEARCNTRPKIQGIIVVSAWIDRQLKPAIFFYPIPNSQYPEPAKQEFLDRILADLKQWLKEYLLKPDAEMVGREMMLIELKDGCLEAHRLRYL